MVEVAAMPARTTNGPRIGPPQVDTDELQFKSSYGNQAKREDTKL